MTVTEQRPTRSPAVDHRRRQRDHLVEMHVDLAFSVARRFAGRGEELDDLRQVALLALVQAAERFDHTRGFAFSTFAVPTIAGALKRHFRDHAWAVRPPRRLQEQYLEVATVVEHLTGELRRFPTTAEIAARGGWSESDVRNARAQHLSRYADHWEGDNLTDHGCPRAVDGNFERIESRVVLDNLLGTLADRERHIMELRFVRELSQADIARRVGVSQMQVSRLLQTSLRTVREKAGSPEDIG